MIKKMVSYYQASLINNKFKNNLNFQTVNNGLTYKVQFLNKHHIKVNELLNQIKK